MARRAHRAPGVRDAAVAERAGAGDGDGALLEVSPPPVGVEADDVVREQPVVDSLAEPLRQDAPVVALRPWDVHEMGEQRSGADSAHDPGSEIEVVVVEEDRRRRSGCSGRGIELFDNRRRKGAIHGPVALLPGRLELAAEVRLSTETPEIVLGEPQQRIRYHVVERVVGLAVVPDQAQPKPGAVVCLLGKGGAAGLGRHEPVLIRHRARDPDHVLRAEQPPERGREPAGAPLRNPVPVLVAAV